MEGSSKHVKVRVKFYASLREKLGVRGVVLKLKENSNVISLMGKVAEIIGNDMSVIVNDELEVRDNVMISVNNNFVKHSDLVRLKLRGGDVVDVMPLPSGG